ncbi:MAG: N-acetylmuramoyl-L-alanine amidase [Thermomonas sp.]|nr:N-acetylmuramoyl-L-alanine amidase [Thermomonas sp.]
MPCSAIRWRNGCHRPISSGAAAGDHRGPRHRAGLRQQSLETLRTANSEDRSAHYLVGDDGRSNNWSPMATAPGMPAAARGATITDLNSASIGIEIDNQVGEPYTEAQVAALLRLLDDLCTRLQDPEDAGHRPCRHGADPQARPRFAVPVAAAGRRRLLAAGRRASWQTHHPASIRGWRWRWSAIR